MITEFVERAKQFLRMRAGAYRRVFIKGGVDTEIVLADLAKFCRAAKSTGHPDANVAARLDGRREVFLRIADHLNLSTEELYRLYHGQSNQLPKGDS